MWRWRAGAIALFTAVAVVIVLNIERLRELKVRRILLYDESYGAIGYDQSWAGVIRLCFMLLAFGLIVAFLLIVPRRRTWFTKLGAATMYIYLLHTFLLYPLRESGVLEGPQPPWVLSGADAAQRGDFGPALTRHCAPGVPPPGRTAGALAVPQGAGHPDRNDRAPSRRTTRTALTAPTASAPARGKSAGHAAI